jgi:hypothetical protein
LTRKKGQIEAPPHNSNLRINGILGGSIFGRGVVEKKIAADLEGGAEAPC